MAPEPGLAALEETVVLSAREKREQLLKIERLRADNLDLQARTQPGEIPPDSKDALESALKPYAGQSTTLRQRFGP